MAANLATHAPRILILDPSDRLQREYGGCTVAVGFRLECAQDHEQGLAKATFLAPDLVFIECSLDGAGIEFCQRLKARLSTSRIPVLGLVAEDDPQTARAMAAAGCTVVLKPCSPERLLVEIAGVLGGQAPGWPSNSPARQMPTVDQVTEMLGLVLREHAHLALRHAELTASANLWANWYERTLTRANHGQSVEDMAVGDMRDLIAQGRAL